MNTWFHNSKDFLYPNLPYNDVKPVGAADFYLAINATITFLEKKFGKSGVIDYFKEMAEKYYEPVIKLWKENGLEGVRGYLDDFFRAEPNSSVTISNEPGKIVLKVKQCPAIHHLKKSGRVISPLYCDQCRVINQTIADKSGIHFNIHGGMGECTQEFIK